MSGKEGYVTNHMNEYGGVDKSGELCYKLIKFDYGDDGAVVARG